MERVNTPVRIVKAAVTVLNVMMDGKPAAIAMEVVLYHVQIVAGLVTILTTHVINVVEVAITIIIATKFAEHVTVLVDLLLNVNAATEMAK